MCIGVERAFLQNSSQCLETSLEILFLEAFYAKSNEVDEAEKDILCPLVIDLWTEMQRGYNNTPLAFPNSETTPNDLE